MKQAIKKASNAKAPTSKTTTPAKGNEATQLNVPEQKPNQFSRFLEASCDCV